MVILCKYIQADKNPPCFVDFGNTNIDHNVVESDGMPSISSLVDDISQFRVDESIKW
jgi:hypothetical protein